MSFFRARVRFDFFCNADQKKVLTVMDFLWPGEVTERMRHCLAMALEKRPAHMLPLNGHG